MAATRDGAAAIEVRGLTKRFGAATAVDGLDFDVRAGAVTGFLGPNGAGKTTTLRMLVGLVAPTAGSATFGGVRYARLQEPARHVGVVLEAGGFHPGRRAVDHLRVLALAAGLPTSRAAAVLDEVGLGDVARMRVRGFSLGMRQRLALAAALLGEPRVLVLDEPANGLDPEGVRWLRGLVRGFAERGGAVLVSSHVLAEVAQLADDVVIVADGRLVVASSLADLERRGRAAVRVRTPRPDALAAALAAHGIASDSTGPDALVAVEATPEAVGLVAAGAGIVVYELVPDELDLEGAFLALTARAGVA